MAFESAGEVAGFPKAGAKLAEEGFEATALAEEGVELLVEELMDEGLGGCGVWIWQQFDRADGLVVEILHPGKIGFAEQDPVFSAVIKAVNEFANAAVEFLLGGERRRS